MSRGFCEVLYLLMLTPRVSPDDMRHVSSIFFYYSFFSPPQFLPGHQKLTERMRKRLYYGLERDVSLDSLSCPVTGEVSSCTESQQSSLMQQSSSHLLRGRHLITWLCLDIAIEIFQKSAPSPIRKLHKKYAAHVARSVWHGVWGCCVLLNECIEAKLSASISASGRRASLPAPWCWLCFTLKGSDTETPNTYRRSPPLTFSWSLWWVCCFVWEDILFFFFFFFHWNVICWFFYQMVASKYLYDEGEEEEVFNDEWGAAGKLDVKTVNNLEMSFLNAIVSVCVWGGCLLSCEFLSKPVCRIF